MGDIPTINRQKKEFIGFITHNKTKIPTFTQQ